MYIFKKDGKFIGMDNQSGGYPYETDRAFSAKEWPSIDEAKKYQKMFDPTWRLFEVKGLNLISV